jgi:hypothetical protein
MANGKLEPISPPSRRRARLGAVLVYTTMHIAFSAQFIRELNSWDDDVIGKCYNGMMVSGVHNHPLVDKVYVITTTFILAVCLMAMMIYLMIMEYEEREGRINPRLVARYGGCTIKTITLMGLVSALTQFPLHLYMMIALRMTNQGLLTDSNENQWGFGQSVAIIMLWVTIQGCICAWFGKFTWKSTIRDGACY